MVRPFKLFFSDQQSDSESVSSKRTPSAGLLQVSLHAVVIGEHGGCGADLCSHVANGGHPCGKKTEELAIQFCFFTSALVNSYLILYEITKKPSS